MIYIFEPYEVVWSLLPFFFFILVIWSFIKKVLGLFGKEPIWDYFIQFLFCSVLLALSMFISRTEAYLFVLSLAPFSYLPEALFCWILYPLLLVIASYIIDHRSNKNKKDQGRFFPRVR